MKLYFIAGATIVALSVFNLHTSWFDLPRLIVVGAFAAGIIFSAGGKQ